MAINPGIYAASMSIFNKDLTLDVDSTILHAEKLLKNGLHGVVLFGSTGMAQLISSSEKKKLISKLSSSKYKDYFVIGTGANALNENVELIKYTLNSGINKFLLGVPAYYKFSDEGAFSYFKNLIKKVPEVRIILYNFEKLFNYKFSIEVVKKLAKEFPKQVVGVKDSSYNLYETLKIPNFLIFPGSETKLLKGLQLGCSGIISAVCNVTAPLARKVYDDYYDNQKQTFNKKLCEIRSAFDSYNLISALHSFMATENEKYKIVLPPLSLLSEKKEKELIFKLKELDFFPEKNKAA